MTTKNALALVGEGGKYSHIFNDIDFDDKQYVAPTDDEQYVAEVEENIQHIAGFFDMGSFAAEGEIFRFMESQEEDSGEVNVQKAQPKEEEKLEVVSEEKREEEFKERQYVYKRAAAEREGLTEPPWSNSTERVVDPNQRAGFSSNVGNRSRETLGAKTGSSSSSSSGFARETTSSTSAAGPGKTRQAMDDFQKMHHSIQRLGYSRTPGWKDYKETEEEYFAQYAKNIPMWKRGLRKTRNFFRSGKGKITMKMGIVIALQMGMAVFGKKYEFESAGQMFGMFSLMLASFYMTRELANEGLDVTGMIF